MATERQQSNIRSNDRSDSRSNNRINRRSDSIATALAEEQQRRNNRVTEVAANR